jgi:DNA-binding NarL/FixJ family response regulator
LLATWPQVRAVWEAANGREALRLVEECRPDVVLMDARMPEMDGVQATRLIKTRWPNVRVIVLSMYPEYLGEALAAGADAFVSKDRAPKQLLALLAALGTAQDPAVPPGE